VDALRRQSLCDGIGGIRGIIKIPEKAEKGLRPSVRSAGRLLDIDVNVTIGTIFSILQRTSDDDGSMAV